MNTIDPLERLSILPSAQQPLLVELGVLQGGHQRAVRGRAGNRGQRRRHMHPGSDRLRDPDALRRARPEAISKQTRDRHDPGGPVRGELDHRRPAPVGRRAEQGAPNASDVGRQLLNQSSLTALSLFQYDPSVGAIVDLRNLTVGGN